MGNFCILALYILMQNFTVCGDVMVFFEFKIVTVRHIGLHRK